MISGYIPVLTSQAGLCLTMENWQELGIDTAAFYLQELLLKPGCSFLMESTSLRNYCGWQGNIILNASQALADSGGFFKLRSPYDGSKIVLSQKDIFVLINRLQPDTVILPKGFSSFLIEEQLSFPQTIKVIETEVLNYEKTQPFNDFLSQFKSHEAKQRYLSGEFSAEQAKCLMERGATQLETNQPASDALAGQIYDEGLIYNLLDSKMANQHQHLCNSCQCPTCSQKLTRAYLHHLYNHTPLLCYRFLIQHNAHHYKDRIDRSSKDH